MEAPVCLIENLQNGSLRVNDEAVDILCKIIQPLIVVAIVGMYRTGKSYLMNKLAGVQKGFELGAAIQAKTKGIWMWCVPHPTVKDHTLVLLDTEGLGNVHKGDKKNDLKIFCLSVLLSSALIYNGRGTIDEDAVEKLHFVGELAEMIKIKSKDNENNEGQFSRHFPAFIWVVRDFTLMLELDGKEITEDDYLENALLPQKPESTEECNRCRDTIRMYFSTRKCFVFDLPSGNKKVLQRMDEVSEEEVSPGFMAQCQTFCEYIYKNAEVKFLDDIKPVCGKILGQLVYKYTEAITSFSVVCMEDTLISISEMENKVAVQKATEHYEKMMREEGRRFPTETLKEFLELSSQHEKEALQIFMNKSFKDSNLSFHAQFMCNVQEKKEEFSKMNEKASHNYCNQLIQKHSRDLEEALEKDLYSNPDGYQKFQGDMAQIVKRYNNEPRKGVEAASVLHDFIMSKHASRMFILRREVDNLYTQNKKRENETQEFKSANETMVAKVFTFNQPTEDNLNTLNKETEKEIQDLKSENEAMVAEDRKRTFLMHLKLLLERAKYENSKRQEILDRVIQSKCWELDIYMLRGLVSCAKTYDNQIESLCRERMALEVPQCQQHTTDLFKENAAEMLCTTLSETNKEGICQDSPKTMEKKKEDQAEFIEAESLLDALNPGKTQKIRGTMSLR
ncbi:guanylate-binding protein 1-like isoform X2 [Aquarana catesbeiana]|uniref:guanylate-binding protein 1-like isoform X2 n=1 Tax=Aquarana catesbeiana TaxID=8400 RepID=UPI003CC9AC4D